MEVGCKASRESSKDRQAEAALNKAPRMIFANGCLRGSQLSCQLTVYGILFSVDFLGTNAVSERMFSLNSANSSL